MVDNRLPAHEPYYGPMYARGMLAREQAHIVSAAPSTVAKMKQQRGRYLAGFGNEDPSGAVGYDPRYQGSHIYDLEQEDDVYGSGIFDPKGRAGTANANMGIFASHGSLPGFIAREVPFTVSKDLTDITDDAAVVMIPSGGMQYVERGGRLSVARGQRPRVPSPQIEPAGWATSYDEVYVYQGRRDAPPRYGPDLQQRRPQPAAQPLTQRPAERLLALRPAEQPMAYRSIVNAGQVQLPVRGLGQEPKSGPTTAQLAAAGAVAGVALALLVSAVRDM